MLVGVSEPKHRTPAWQVARTMSLLRMSDDDLDCADKVT